MPDWKKVKEKQGSTEYEVHTLKLADKFLVRIIQGDKEPTHFNAELCTAVTNAGEGGFLEDPILEYATDKGIEDAKAGILLRVSNAFQKSLELIAVGA